METLLTQLENNEAVLLMYLANELPAEDRAEVEAMLARDDTLRRQLDELRLSHARVNAIVSDADRETPLPSAFAAARAFGDAVRQREAQRPSIDEREEYVRRRIPWFVYPAAAAAVVALGMFAWYQSVADETSAPPRDMVYVPSAAESPYVEMWNAPEPDPELAELNRELVVLDFLESDMLR